MKLTNCPACRATISPDAPACPRCGHRMPSAQRFKAAEAVGLVTMFASAAWCVVQSMSGETAVGVGVIAFAVGIAIYTAARVGAWWCHQ